MGVGWNLQGLSAITRGPKNLADDGVVAGINLTADDALFLDGQRLVPIHQAGNQIEYRCRIDNQSRIIATLDSHSMPLSFTVETRAGLTMQYGNTADSHATVQSKQTIVWACNRIVDSCGNYIDFMYRTNQKGDYGLLRASYTGNLRKPTTPYAAIELTYGPATAVVGYLHGNQIVKDSQVLKIGTYVDGHLVTEYDLAHSNTASASQFVLSSIQEVTATGFAYRPTTFTYTAAPSSNLWADQTNYHVPATVPFSLNAIDPAGIKCCDLNADGHNGILYSSTISGTDHPQAFIFSTTNSQWEPRFDYTPPIAFSHGHGAIPGVRLVDVNGDGRCDLVYAPEGALSQAQTFLNEPTVTNGSHWVEKTGLKLPVALELNSQPNKAVIFLKNLDGHNHSGVLWKFVDASGVSRHGAFICQADQWVALGSAFEPPLLTTPNTGGEPAVLVVDANCDGQPDLLYRTRDASGAVVSHAYTGSTSGWHSDDTYNLNIPQWVSGYGIEFIDVNVDTYPDAVIGYDNGTQVYKNTFLATAAHPPWTQGADAQKPPIVFANASQGRLGVRIADLDGDGRLDLIYNTVLPGSTIQGAYLNKPAGWPPPANRYIPPSPLCDLTGQTIVACVADCNADGLADLLYLYCPTGPALYLNTPPPSASAWPPPTSPGLVPPQPIAAQGKQDLGVRFADIDGSGMVAMMWSSAVAGSAAPGAYRNHGQGWDTHTPSTFYPPKPFVDSNGNDGGVRLIDVNGDGIADFVYSFQLADGSPPSRHVWIGSATGWIPNDAWALPADVIIASQAKGDGGVQFVDLNGDGLTDVLFAVRDIVNNTERRNAYLNNGYGTLQAGGPTWLLAPQYAPPPGCVFSAVYLTSGSPPASLPLGCQLVDVNGDRLPDLLFNYVIPNASGGGGTPAQGAYLNTGTGWPNTPAPGAYNPPQRLDGGDQNQQVLVQLQDVNADGLADLIYVRRSGNSTPIPNTYLSTGTGWANASTSAAWNLPTAAIGAGQSDPGFQLIDVNGDGLIDILYSRIEQGGTTPVAGAYLNNGVTWLWAPEFAPPTPFSQFGQGDLGVRLFDVNGDGLPDIVVNRTGSTIGNLAAAYVNQTKIRIDLLRSTTNGNGVKTEFSHHCVTGLQNYDTSTVVGIPSPPPPAYPIVESVPSLYVVTDRTVRHVGGRTEKYSYNYGHFRSNTKSGRPLGFFWRTTKNVVNGMVTYAQFAQDDVLAGQPTSTISGIGGVHVSEISNNWTPTPTPALNNMTYWRVTLQSTSTSNRDLDGTPIGTMSTTYVYADHDNPDSPTQVTSDVGSVVGTEKHSVVDSEYYAVTPTQKFLGRLKQSTHTTSAPGFTPQARVTQCTYDGTTGLLASEIIDSGLPQAVTHQYTYDIFGNKVTSRTSGPQVTARERHGTFDDRGRFLISQSNELSQTTATDYDMRFGTPTKVTGANGRITRTAYDGHGREIQQTSTSGVVTQTSYGPPDATSPTAVSKVDRTVSGLHTTTSRYLDDNGTTVRTTTPGFNNVAVLQDTQLDKVGRPSMVSRPYFQGETPQWTVTTYDDLDRPKVIRNPDGSTIQHSFSGLSSTTTDPRGNITKSTFNARGLLIEMVDPFLNHFQLAYDPFDRLIQITRPDGRAATFSYDLQGRRTSAQDPDAGLWQYEYDPLNKLLRQVDAKGQVTKFEYDLLGRPVLRSRGNGTTNWTYDTSTNGVGMVAQVTTSSGYSEIFGYDSAGRPSQITVQTPDETLVTNTQYDAYGRIVSTQYPTGFAVRNLYDPSSGRLASVADAASGFVYWKATSMDATGRVATEVLGNGVSSAYTRSQQTGYITKEQIFDAAGNVLEGAEYQYDPSGNVTDQLNCRPHRHRHFTYDALDRITKVAGCCQCDIDVTYDALGRITRKSDVGDYGYGMTTPDGVASITRPDGWQFSFDYDANGAATRTPRACIEYTPDNLVRSIWAGYDRHVSYDYTYDGRCFKETRCDEGGATVTVRTGLYERVCKLWPGHHHAWDHVQHRHFIVGNEGIVAVFESAENRHCTHHGEFCEHCHRTRYVHRDRLGSITMLTDDAGCVAQRFEYDPWGVRRALGFDEGFSRGFTGHESLDSFGFINMAGRLYDPELGLFVQADVGSPPPLSSQHLSKFIYALNNPLKFVDPSGHFSIGGFLSSIASPFVSLAKAVAGAVSAIVNFVVQNWRPIVAIAAGIVVGILAAPLGPVAAAAIAGAVYGGTSTALYGGSVGDILKNALIGAATGALSAGIASAGVSYIEGVGLRAVQSGLNAAINGGDFWKAALSGAVIGVTGPLMVQLRGFDGSQLAQTAASAIVGGTLSVIGGGKFANGAESAAFAAVAQGAVDVLEDQGRLLTDEEYQWVKENLPIANSIDLDGVRIVNGRFVAPPTSSWLLSMAGDVFMGSDASRVLSNLGVSEQDLNLLVNAATQIWQYQQSPNVVWQRLGITQVIPSSVYDWQGIVTGQAANISQQLQTIQQTYRNAAPQIPVFNGQQ